MEKIFREDYGKTQGEGGAGGDTDKKSKDENCRACHSYKSWAKLQSAKLGDGVKSKIQNENQAPHDSTNCPLDVDGLGRSTWSFLHSMAAYYPDRPTDNQQKEMSVFMKLFSKYYPCSHCAKDFKQSIAVSPPETKSRWSLSQWMCRMHNEVNRKLGKEEFDCKLVDERWKDGWKDGTCG